MKLYFTNDIHSNFGNLSRLSSFLKQEKQPGDLLIDAGDFMDLKDLLIQGNLEGVHHLLQYLDYDCMAIGNNEIDLGDGGLSRIASKMTMLSCNLTQNDRSDVPNILKSTIIEKNDIRFLIIGVSPYYSTADLSDSRYNVFFNMCNLNVVDPIPAIKSELAEHQGSYDIAILLSHSGQAIDETLLNRIDGIDICIGGHTHSKVEAPYQVNGAIYMQAFNYAECIGILELDIQDRKIQTYYGKLVENDFLEDVEFRKRYLTEFDVAKTELSKPIATIDGLDFNPYRESELINFICDSLYEEYPCDFAFMHAGICEGSLRGDVSVMKLIELSPSKLNPTRFRVRGSNFEEAIRLSFDEEYIAQSGRGSGFRGHILGCICVSRNVKIIKSPIAIYIDGILLDKNKEYNIISDDYMQRAQYYPSLRKPDDESVFYDGFIRDLIYRHITDTTLIESSKIKRFII